MAGSGPQRRLTPKQAEGLIRAAALDSAKVIITDHAEDRMEERDITDRDLFRILQEGTVAGTPRLTEDMDWKCKVVKRLRGSRVAGSRCRDGDCQGRLPDRGHSRMGGSAMTDRLYHYTRCGLDYVYLSNGYRLHETSHGRGVAIEDVDGLHRSIAADIVRHRAQLQGQDVRFLRKEMDLSQQGLAILMGVDAQTVARWEKGRTTIPGPADRLLRVIYERQVNGSSDVAQVIAALNDLDDRQHDTRTFHETSEGWRVAA